MALETALIPYVDEGTAIAAGFFQGLKGVNAIQNGNTVGGIGDIANGIFSVAGGTIVKGVGKLAGKAVAPVVRAAASDGASIRSSDNLVLGSRYHGLEELTIQLGERHLLNDMDWREQVITAADLLKAGDEDIKVSFQLDGLPGGTPGNILHQAVIADTLNHPSPTQWELATMQYAGVLHRIDWYQDGKLIPNPYG